MNVRTLTCLFLVIAGWLTFVTYKQLYMVVPKKEVNLSKIYQDMSGENRLYPLDVTGMRIVSHYSRYAESDISRGWKTIIEKDPRAVYVPSTSVDDVPTTVFFAETLRKSQKMFPSRYIWDAERISKEHPEIDLNSKIIDFIAIDTTIQFAMGEAKTGNPYTGDMTAFGTSIRRGCKSRDHVYWGNFLHLAAWTGDYESFKWLLENTDLDPFMQTCHNENIFHIAARTGSIMIIEALLDHPDFDPKYMEQTGYSTEGGPRGITYLSAVRSAAKFRGWEHKYKYELPKYAWQFGITSGYKESLYRCKDMRNRTSCDMAYFEVEFLCANYQKRCDDKLSLAEWAKHEYVGDYNDPKRWNPEVRSEVIIRLTGFPPNWSGVNNDYLTLKEPYLERVTPKVLKARETSGLKYLIK